MTTLFDNAAFDNATLDRATAANAAFGGPTLVPTPVAPAHFISLKKHSLLPVLTVLFLISYGLMTMLIVEQGSTIESQRSLIHELLRDSTELAGFKGNAARETNSAEGRRRAPSQAQVPPAQAPQTPSTQAPSSQVAPQHQGETLNGKGQKPKFQLPGRPASDLADERRALRTI